MLKVDNKVICLGKYYENYPSCYPKKGTIGTIVTDDNDGSVQRYQVQWERGSTSGDDCWWAYNDDIEPYQSQETKNKLILFNDWYYRAIFENEKITLYPASREENALGWARDYYRLLQDIDADRLSLTQIITSGRKVIALYGKGSDYSVYKDWAMSICNKRDTYNYEVGRAIALARLYHDDIPDCVFEED